MACIYLRAMGIVHGRGRMYWPDCPLPATLESSRELAKNLAANVYAVYLIHPLVLVGFAYAFHHCCLVSFAQVCYFCLLLFSHSGFLLSDLVRRVPLANRIL